MTLALRLRLRKRLRQLRFGLAVATNPLELL
jgi:hypothetical protein